MQYSTTIFGQLLAFLPKEKLKKFTGQHNSEKYIKKLTVWNHLVVLLYAQATGKDSLREIETGLLMNHSSWHHLGINTVSKSSIARVNNTRSPIVFEKLFYALLEQCKSVTQSRKFSFNNPLYSLDASVVNLCLSLFDWAKYRTKKGALKMHILLDNRTGLPTVVSITAGNVADVVAGRNMEFKLESGSILVFDRGYLDHDWWYRIDQQGLFFVTRPKKNTIIIVSERRKTLESNILGDDTIWIGHPCEPKYKKELRRVRYLDEKHGEYVFITNNFVLTASEIALIYKERWQIELFFKWIKQNLKVKTFLGTSKNAVMNQIWVAMIYYLLLSYIKFQTKMLRSLLELSWMIKETVLVRRPLIDILSLTPTSISKFSDESYVPMTLF
ncbi:MAG: IS4 family transposase [Nitrosopumilaceae archaeon]|nr:IS4 family transposase [Nitrosopumilaceae archaeon]